MGKKKRVLFLCSMGKNRSKTASRLYKHKYDTRFGGIHDIYYYRHKLLLDLAWADYIVIMRDYMKASIPQEFRHKVKSLNIMDIYEFNSEVLKERIIKQMDMMDL